MLESIANNNIRVNNLLLERPPHRSNVRDPLDYLSAAHWEGVRGMIDNAFGAEAFVMYANARIINPNFKVTISDFNIQKATDDIRWAKAHDMEKYITYASGVKQIMPTLVNYDDDDLRFMWAGISRNDSYKVLDLFKHVKIIFSDKNVFIPPIDLELGRLIIHNWDKNPRELDLDARYGMAAMRILDPNNTYRVTPDGWSVIDKYMRTASQSMDKDFLEDFANIKILAAKKVSVEENGIKLVMFDEKPVDNKTDIPERRKF